MHSKKSFLLLCLIPFLFCSCGKSTESSMVSSSAVIEGWDNWGNWDNWNGSEDSSEEETDWSVLYGELDTSCAVRSDCFYFNPANGLTEFRAEYASFDGGCYVTDNYVGHNETGSSVTFHVRSLSDATVLVYLRLATSTDYPDGFKAGRAFTLSNGSFYADLSKCTIASTGSWTAFDDYAIGEIPLTQGENDIVLTSLLPIFNVESMYLKTKSEETSLPVFDLDASTRVEAEETAVHGGRISQGGSGYIFDYTENNATLKFRVKTSAAGNYSLSARSAVLVNEEFTSVTGERIRVCVNENEITYADILAGSEGTWYQTLTDRFVGTFLLKEGENTVEITLLRENFNNDYFVFEAV